MGSSYFGNAGVFLIQTVFGFYIAVLVIRIMLQLVRANFFNPVCQFLVKITNPVLFPLRRVIPNWGRMDLAALAVAWVLKIIALLLVLAILGGGAPIGRVIAVAGAELIDMAVLILMVVIFIKVLLSWVAPHGDSPVTPLLYQLSEPVVGPIQRLLPPMGGLDFSPFVALIALQLGRMLLVLPLLDAARGV